MRRIAQMRLPVPPRAASLRRPVILGLCVSLMALAACDERGVRITTTRSSSDSKGVLKVITALQCPDSIGALTRKGSAQSDGSVCIYTGPRGAEVSLHLIKVGDEPVDAVLARFENQLTAAMPHAMAQINNAAAEDARAEADAARIEANTARDQADAAAGDAAEAAHISGPGVNIDAQGDRARVSLPGIHVEADGDKANVRIGGFTIRANDNGAAISNTARPKVRLQGDLTTGDGQESVNIRANEGGAEIRTRAPGDATRQTYLLTDSSATDNGWRLVGYEARGPRGGPIVVATVRARERNSNRLFDDAKDLVTLNVGK